MPDPGRSSSNGAGNADAEKRSSFGDNSPSVTPKDVVSRNAASRDLIERNITSPDPAVKNEALLDDALELTFPASDPIAVSGGAFLPAVPKPQ